ncbi:thiol-disulfide oxidoreductase DCC family protein [Cellulophaga baltica]|uniref:thiol-disulfide oxidoreductase DCC family protein n=1 Tax=Cellulophaga baltica TaxID=76594 RepID=UPI0037C686F8
MQGNNSHKIVLFDGVCNLCNTSIHTIIKYDKKDEFRFASLQSEIGQKLAKERHIDTTLVDSIILIEPGIAYYTKSTAALLIGKSFGGLWSLLTIFEWVPEKFRDSIYDYVANNRYKWYGKQDACMVPTAELKAKFIE